MQHHYVIIIKKMEQTSIEWVNIFRDFVNQYEYEFDETKWHFMNQPFPILSQCIGLTENGIEKIDTQDKFDRYSEQVYEQAKHIFLRKGKLSDNLQGVMFICIHKPFHIPFLIYIEHRLDKDTFSEILESVWINTEFPHQNDISVMVRLFSKANKKKLMDIDEIKAYNKLPKIVKVYRGLQRGAIRKGLSWTTDIKTAKWFADRFKRNGKVLIASVNKKDIYAYKLKRDEFEIILNPNKLMEESK